MKPKDIVALLLDEAKRKPKPAAEPEQIDPKKWVMQKMPTAVKGPFIRVQFLDGEREVINVPCKWIKGAYSQGSSMHPGVVPVPNAGMLRQFSFSGTNRDAGEDVMEYLHSARYEGDERNGVMEDDWDPEYEDGPSYRPFRWQYFNDEDDDCPYYKYDFEGHEDEGEE